MKLRRLGGVLEVGDEVIPVLLLLQTGEHHLGAGDVLLGVGEVNVKGIGTPGDAYRKKNKKLKPLCNIVKSFYIFGCFKTQKRNGPVN